jgi:hypothetical protein
VRDGSAETPRLGRARRRTGRTIPASDVARRACDDGAVPDPRNKRPIGAPQVKGIAILGIARSVRELLGEETYGRVLAYLPDPVGGALRHGPLVPSSWIPLAWHVSLHDAVLAVTRGGPTIFRRIAKHTTLSQLHGVYKVFARLAGPESVLPRAGAILSTYYSHANIDVREVRRGYCSTAFYGCTGFTPAIWENICGSCEGALEASGAGSVRVRMAPAEPPIEDGMIINAHWV